VTRFRFAAVIFVMVLALGFLHAQQHAAQTPDHPTTSTQKQGNATRGEQQQGQAGQSHSIGGELSQASNEAAGEGQKESEENAQFTHSPSVRLIARVTGLSLEGAYWVSIIFNFVLLAVFIVLISKSKLPAMFRTRTGEIQRGIAEARKASEDANRRLADVEARLMRLDADVAEMSKVAEKEGAAEEARIVQAAEEEKRKIVESANAEIVAAAKLAERELKAYAAELAVSLAEKQIHVDANTDRALVSDFVEHLNGAGSPGEKVK
jgi:F-type H+-transporting ATPase subunit b